MLNFIFFSLLQIEDPKSSQVPFLQNPQMPNDAQKNGVLSAPMMNEFSARSYRDSAPAAVQPQSQPEINVQKLHLQENPTMNQQVPPVAASGVCFCHPSILVQAGRPTFSMAI